MANTKLCQYRNTQCFVRNIEILDLFDLRLFSSFRKVASEIQTPWKVKVLSGTEQRHVTSRAWASDDFFQRGGPKVVKLVFSHSKLRK